MNSLLRSVMMTGTMAASFGLAVSDLSAQPPAEKARNMDDYPLTPDSERHPGVPQGKVFSFPFETSRVFPGTTRTISVYVPAQYTGETPACVYVGLDGLGFNAPVVFDNLIHRREMPVTIGIGVSPGNVPAAAGAEDPRFNRSFEFDGMNGALARLLVEEIFPAVEQHQTPDGLPIRLSNNPNDRCTGGGSTGGIAAFTLAWERPDQFRRVFSAIGTYVGMRGGDRYPVLVRKTEPKPIRIFQQDGENDQWMGGPEVGDWWMGNQALERALTFAGYDHQHVWGTGPHSGKHGAAVFPDAMRSLWKDWPQPIVARTDASKNHFLKAILEPGEEWEEIPLEGIRCGQIAATPSGDIRVQDLNSNAGRKLKPDGTLSAAPSGELLPLPPGTPWTVAGNGDIVFSPDLHSGALTVTHDNRVYQTDSSAGEVWLIRPNGDRTRLDAGLIRPGGITLSPDGAWLAVFERGTHTGFSYRVLPDGTVDSKARLYSAHASEDAAGSDCPQACMDRDGRLYAATEMGVQVFDRNGRSRAILPLPSGPVTAICFGGEKLNVLYVVSSERMYRRKMESIGAPSFLPPITLPKWSAG
jgi:enterochelin esterase-like enzyme